MRFLVDECTGPAVARWLRQQNHDVFSVYEQARGMDDDRIIQKAFDESGGSLFPPHLRIPTPAHAREGL
jgi:hypothetical protein